MELLERFALFEYVGLLESAWGWKDKSAPHIKTNRWVGGGA